MGTSSSEDARQVLRANLWPTGTRVMLLSVPWDSAYRDVVTWESAEARDAWFSGQTDVAWTDVSFNYLWPNQPVAVPVPFSTAYRYNYIAVTNPAQPVTDEGPVRTYYYFVTDVQYLSPQASNLMVQLDVMTTYAEHISYGRAFVDRGHIAMANENSVSTNRYQYLTLPEGIDVGSGYVATHREFLDLGGDTGAVCVIVSTADLLQNPGTVSQPALRTAGGQVFDGVPNGCSVWGIHANDLTLLMDQLQDASWVSQCVIDIYLVPGALVTLGDSPAKLFGTGVSLYTVTSPGATTSAQEAVASLDTEDAYYLLPGEDAGDVPDKLYCYPYSVVELTTLNGNPQYMKPEYVPAHMDFGCFGQAGVPSPRFAVFPMGYQAAFGAPDQRYPVKTWQETDAQAYFPGGSSYDNAVWLQNFPHISVVNNNYQLYLASNANRLAYQYSSAGWQLDRANMVAANTYGNALINTGTGLENALLQNQTAMENASRGLQQGTVNSVASGLAGVGEAIGTGNVFGGAMSAAGAIMGVANANNAYNMQTANAGTALQTNMNTIQAQQDVASNNNQLARNVAQGDYQNKIAGIDATVQDAELTPPSTSGQTGGDAFTYKQGLVGIVVTYKTIMGASRAAVIDYFRRYGYAVRRWLALGSPRQMLCMTKFAYWRVLESNITCAWANESERETMRGVIEKGVTLWDAPESIGNTDLAANEPRSGYRY